MIELTIDNKRITVEPGTTILKAARQAGIEIPTLCHFEMCDMGIENKPGGCRICVVEVEGRRNLAPSCVTEAQNGMVINTHNIRVLNARKTVLKLIISDHPFDCLVCAKSGQCELQHLATQFGIRSMPYGGEQSHYRKDTSPSIIRDVDKCILCRRCEMVCNEVQTVGALSAVNRGFMAVVAPAFEMNLEKSPCTYCGQCVSVCPTGALTEVDHSNEVLRALSNPKKTVVVQTAPAVRAALGEEFGLEPGTLVTGKLVAALRRLGFDYVFDTDFSADLTIMEEGTELLNRLKGHLAGDPNVRIPLLTSCCPGWVNFFEHNFPDLLDVPSTAKSPQQMFGAIAKSYFAEKIGVSREDLIVVSIMPCLAKKYECQRDEFKVDGNPDVDYSISTRELAAFIKQANIDFLGLPDEEFDDPLGESSGAGVIFGNTGGVIEAACRTAYELYTGKTLDKVEFHELRGMEGIRSATVDFDGLKLNIGIAHGLGNARKLLDEVRAGKSQYHAIEIMACPGGCISGGGQPYTHLKEEILVKRTAALYTEDQRKAIRKSHENPSIIKLYNEFLGEPGSHRAHSLLHTEYFPKSNEVTISLNNH
ncbi:MAG: NADH-dependent [FeFe] hydrogenase, group A6 [Petrimonas sp.]|jgi:NADP-reducing hydrogenase subunit HndD|uniref:NADH-dependent [FeFe] hydrogenase, group A6 n=1 Tax=Petrimonas sulfuriphila TaxID=285070 RepID=UPI000E7EBB62|nr:NADH-dependent [FeFe] hydrogenase, group A6 [Petrimonas sp.]HAC73319.1 NADH:ubiquinone oxidoreductase [Porphyromonadaceae bacterium]MDD2910394.1 NADH-dependent [FeFe] hydrogenase, group A6 [Petrimonas sp.]MDD3541745.1 NADH-dependent [FeFe] hydrogenase, group A6 [Petrimonas sp.]MDD4015116.1 NADH-dependent [FeFe] hydrogenase, group A6 [Petrimonas sp.]